MKNLENVSCVTDKDGKKYYNFLYSFKSGKDTVHFALRAKTWKAAEKYIEAIKASIKLEGGINMESENEDNTRNT